MPRAAAFIGGSPVPASFFTAAILPQAQHFGPAGSLLGVLTRVHHASAISLMPVAFIMGFTGTDVRPLAWLPATRICSCVPFATPVIHALISVRVDTASGPARGCGGIPLTLLVTLAIATSSVAVDAFLNASVFTTGLHSDSASVVSFAFRHRDRRALLDADSEPSNPVAIVLSTADSIVPVSGTGTLAHPSV